MQRRDEGVFYWEDDELAGRRLLRPLPAETIARLIHSLYGGDRERIMRALRSREGYTVWSGGREVNYRIADAGALRPVYQKVLMYLFNGAAELWWRIRRGPAAPEGTAVRLVEDAVEGFLVDGCEAYTPPDHPLAHEPLF